MYGGGGGGEKIDFKGVTLVLWSSFQMQSGW